MLQSGRLEATPGIFLAFQKLGPAAGEVGRPGIVYVNGFRSEMANSRKAAFLRDTAMGQGLPFLTYDHFAHGQSSGAFEDATVGAWARDLRSLLEKESAGPQVLVGSSMGFWLCLLAVLRGGDSLRERIRGLLGIAPSVNFTERWMREVPEAVRTEGAQYRRPSQFSPSGYYDVPIRLLEEGAGHCLAGPYFVPCPVCLIYGERDAEVKYDEVLSLAKDLRAPRVELVPVEGGDHRLSRDEDLDHIKRALIRIARFDSRTQSPNSSV